MECHISAFHNRFNDMKLTVSISIYLLTFAIALSATPIKTICGEYTYVVPENVHREEAMRIAAEQARIAALETAYGTLIMQENTTFIQNINGKSDIDFQSLGSSDVRGEWLGDTQDPIYRFYVDEHTGVTSIYAKVCGKSREIIRNEIPLQIHILHNNYESENFRANDELYVSILSPLNGYLTIFLLDETKQVLCMLPYQSQADGAYAIAANRQYTFFSKAHASTEERRIVDEYVLTCNTTQETNYLYFIFSTQPFSKPATTNNIISFKDFNTWRVQLLRYDSHAQVLTKTIIIRP